VAAEFSVRGSEKLAALSRALKGAGNDLRRELDRGLDRAVKPLTGKVRESAPRFLPNRYAAELLPTLKFGVTHRPDRVTLSAKAATRRGKPRSLAALNRGRLRHPLYGDRSHWLNQPVKPGFWDTPLLAGRDEVRDELLKVMDAVAKGLEEKL